MADLLCTPQQSKSCGRTQARSPENLLTHRARHKSLGPAFAFIGLAAHQQRPRRTITRGVHVEAAARRETLALTEFVGGSLAIRRAVGSGRASHAALDARR